MAGQGLVGQIDQFNFRLTAKPESDITVVSAKPKPKEIPMAYQSFAEQAQIEEAICRAPNGKTLNRILPEGVAVVNRGRGHGFGKWAFTVDGQEIKSGDFADVKKAAADWMVV